MVAILSEPRRTSTPETGRSPGFKMTGNLDRIVEGALAVGVLGVSIGAILSETVIGVPFSATLQWVSAICGSAAGALWGAMTRGYSG